MLKLQWHTRIYDETFHVDSSSNNVKYLKFMVGKSSLQEIATLAIMGRYQSLIWRLGDIRSKIWNLPDYSSWQHWCLLYFTYSSHWLGSAGKTAFKCRWMPFSCSVNKRNHCRSWKLDWTTQKTRLIFNLTILFTVAPRMVRSKERHLYSPAKIHWTSNVWQGVTKTKTP